MLLLEYLNKALLSITLGAKFLFITVDRQIRQIRNKGCKTCMLSIESLLKGFVAIDYEQDIVCKKSYVFNSLKVMSKILITSSKF